MNRREGQAGAWRHWGDKRVVTACEGDGPQYQGLPWHSSSKLATLMRMLDRIFRGMPVELDTSSLSDEVEVLSDSAEVGVNGGSKSCSSGSSSVDKGVKVVVFSQWTSMLDLVEFALQQRDASQRITHRRLDGSMTQAARSSAVNSFNQDDGVRLFLISLK
jgi:SNF2 family DNA or RNA helicase